MALQVGREISPAILAACTPKHESDSDSNATQEYDESGNEGPSGVPNRSYDSQDEWELESLTGREAPLGATFINENPPIYTETESEKSESDDGVGCAWEECPPPYSPPKVRPMEKLVYNPTTQPKLRVVPPGAAKKMVEKNKLKSRNFLRARGPVFVDGRP